MKSRKQNNSSTETPEKEERVEGEKGKDLIPKIRPVSRDNAEELGYGFTDNYAVFFLHRRRCYLMKRRIYIAWSMLRRRLEVRLTVNREGLRIPMIRLPNLKLFIEQLRGMLQST
jgi:hypothetical protein